MKQKEYITPSLEPVTMYGGPMMDWWSIQVEDGEIDEGDIGSNGKLFDSDSAWNKSNGLWEGW